MDFTEFILWFTRVGAMAIDLMLFGAVLALAVLPLALIVFWIVNRGHD